MEDKVDANYKFASTWVKKKRLLFYKKHLNMEFKKNTNSAHYLNVIIRIAVLVAVLGFIGTITFFFVRLDPDSIFDSNPLTTANLFGGAISGAFSCLAFLGVIWSLKLQMDNNTSQNKLSQKEQFESSFFNMLSMHQQIVNELHYSKTAMQRKLMDMANDKAPVDFNGRQVFEEIYCKRIKMMINNKSLQVYQNFNDISIFDHYFRSLYRIIKFVDEATYLEEDSTQIEKRYGYTCIVRGVLSRYELCLIFYNGLFFDKFKLLIEKYALLKNLREDLLASSIEAKGKNCNNDYELCRTIKIAESNVHIQDTFDKISTKFIVPKYYEGAFLNQKELTELNVEVKYV